MGLHVLPVLEEVVLMERDYVMGKHVKVKFLSVYLPGMFILLKSILKNFMERAINLQYTRLYISQARLPPKRLSL